MTGASVGPLGGRVAFISGASSGIGLATARAFSREGASLILAARRVGRLEELASELRRAHGTDSLVVPLDVRDRRGVETAVAGLAGAWAAIDILVNNAGLARGMAAFHEASTDDWEEMVDTNIKGLLYLTRAVVPGMVTRGRGDVINVGSIAGHQVYPRGHVYCATKAAVAALSQGIRIDLIDTPVRVTEVAPGLVQTEFSLVRHRGNAERAAKTYSTFRVLAPEDVAETILFCVTRPPHVAINQVTVMPSEQANTMVHRRPGGSHT